LGLIGEAASTPVTEQSLRQDVVAAGAILFRVGLIDYMGHASARIPGTDRVLIKPRHSATMSVPADLTAARVVVVDLDGNLVEGDEAPPSERFIHTAIYRARPDVGGVVHTHQVLATAFGSVGRPIEPILHVEAPLVAGGVPLYPSPELITTAALGAAVAATLADRRVCHLQGHGIVAVGESVREAVVRAIHLERLARANLLAAQLGGSPRLITPDEMGRVSGPMVDYSVRWAYYARLAAEPDLPPNW
jgi:L-ribulose-5-phosphate 4-epimerase